MLTLSKVPMIAMFAWPLVFSMASLGARPVLSSRSPTSLAQTSAEKAPGHLTKPLRCQFPSIFFISDVAASVSEWKRIPSLTLAATAQPSRRWPAAAGKLRRIGSIANENISISDSG